VRVWVTPGDEKEKVLVRPAFVRVENTLDANAICKNKTFQCVVQGLIIVCSYAAEHFRHTLDATERPRASRQTAAQLFINAKRGGFAAPVAFVGRGRRP
jgi:hypothetical protein